MNYIRPSGAIALGLVLAAFVTCTGEERAPQLVDDTIVPAGGAAGRGGSSSDEPDASAGGPDASAGTGGAGDAGVDGTVVNCGEVTCRGAGRCVLRDDTPTCVCDEGYTLLESGDCVVDETCIELRLIEEGCRQRIDLEPAIAMAFYVETCASTTVQPAILGDVATAFKVLEDDNDLGDESFAAVFDRGVESYITIALDMSGSVASNANLLPELIGLVQELVIDLTPDPEEPPVRMELIAFGRSLHVKTPFTSTLSDVSEALADMLENPDEAVDEPDGTNLNGVINLALGNLDNVIGARVEQTRGAVISTGTLIIITDGRDTGGVRLENIAPRFNVISIGVSGNIDDTELTRVGPQGSFLAPEQEDRVLAFDTVAQRVKEYPERAYLLAYCSPAVAGTHEVIATLANLEAHASASCGFNATNFGSGSACNQAFIETYCEEPIHACGAFLACDPPCEELPADAGPPRDDWAFSD
jgi:hypothetical protein